MGLEWNAPRYVNPKNFDFVPCRAIVYREENEKNLAMQDTTNLAALCGVWVGLACCHGNSSGFVILIIIIYFNFLLYL